MPVIASLDIALKEMRQMWQVKRCNQYRLRRAPDDRLARNLIDSVLSWVVTHKNREGLSHFLKRVGAW